MPPLLIATSALPTVHPLTSRHSRAATLAHERGKNDPDQVRSGLKQAEFPVFLVANRDGVSRRMDE
jgi:hypothetical protein